MERLSARKKAGRPPNPPIPDKALRARVAVDLWETQRQMNAVSGVWAIIHRLAEATGEDFAVEVDQALEGPSQDAFEALDDIRDRLQIPLHPPREAGK